MKGPGNWKMNCSLLDDEDYKEDITRVIPLWIADGQKEFTDNRMIWDWTKYNIRAHAIQYSKRKVKERGEKEFDLQEELTKAKSKLENNTNDHNKTYYNVVQEKLESFYEEKTKGVLIRERPRWHEKTKTKTKSKIEKNYRRLYDWGMHYTPSHANVICFQLSTYIF